MSYLHHRPTLPMPAATSMSFYHLSTSVDLPTCGDLSHYSSSNLPCTTFVQMPVSSTMPVSTYGASFIAMSGSTIV